MNFTIPTTKDELLNTLQEIFYFYRIRREVYEGPTLVPLTLDTLDYTLSTQLELTAKATSLVSGEHEEKKLEYKNKIEEELSALTVKEENATQDALAKSQSIIAIYTESENKIRQEATLKGFASSNAVLDAIANLEQEKNTKLAEITSEKTEKLTEIAAKKSALNTRLNNIDTYFATLLTKQVEAKVCELKQKEEETEREVIKYNNSISEKTQNSNNNLLQASANLELKYMQLHTEMISKDMLVQMGYYKDVIACLNGYYSTLTAVQAYSDLLNDTQIPIYLDDYYATYLYMYKTRAGM